MTFAFMGISFQSSNFFDDFSNFSSSFFKKPDIEKEYIKGGLQLAGARVGKAARSAVSIGATAAGVPPVAAIAAKTNLS